jgi:hypothetical protein
MVHGIGQRLEKANLVDDVVDFRRVTANLAERYLTSYQRSTQRVLFIPCQVKTSVNPAKFFPLSNTQESCTFFFFSYKSTLVQKTPLDLLVCLSHTQQNPSNMSVLIKNSGLRHLKIRVNMQSIVNLIMGYFVIYSNKMGLALDSITSSFCLWFYMN